MYLVGFLQQTHLMYSPRFMKETLTFQAALAEGRAFLVRARAKLRANLTSRVFLSRKMCQSQEGERVLKGKVPKKIPYFQSLLTFPFAYAYCRKNQRFPFLLKYFFILAVLHLW